MGEETVGSYRLGEELGRGGMGVVYAAEHVKLGRRAAVKMLLPALSNDAELVQRFFHEAKAAATIAHPGIVDVFDFGVHDDGSAYLVMPLLAGESLSTRLQRESRLAPNVAIEVARQVAGALAAAHREGIIHRDLKPDNIFLVDDEDMRAGVRAVILDFGIAKLAPDDVAAGFRTRTGTVMGTPAYMSPEQCVGDQAIDHRSDLYALGCVIFHCVVGRPPFEGRGHGEVIAAQIRDAPPSMSERVDGVPDALEMLVGRLLEKDPKDRLQAATELRVTLSEVANQAPTSRPNLLSTWPDGRGGPVHARKTAPTKPATDLDSQPTLKPTPKPVPATPSKPLEPTVVTGSEAEVASGSRRRLWAAIAVIVLVGGAVSVALWARGDEETGPLPLASSATPDSIACDLASHDATLAGWRRYVAEFPSGACAARATARISLLETPARERLFLLEATELELVQQALEELVPITWPVTSVVTVEATMSAAEISAVLTSEVEGRLVLVKAGRYVLDESLKLKARKLVVVGDRDGEIFVMSGKAVLQVEESEDVVLFGLYMNHHAKEYTGRIGRELYSWDFGCWVEVYNPAISKSNVLEISSSKRVGVWASELEGSGFIGVYAKDSSDITVKDSILHDCVSEAVKLESSDAVVTNTLIHAVGSRSYRLLCAVGRIRPCHPSALKPGEPRSISFKTAITVDAASRLVMKRSTLHVPKPLSRSKAFDVDGTLVLSDSVIAQRSAAIDAGKNSSVEVSGTCFSARSVKPAGKDSHVGQSIDFVPAPKGARFNGELVAGQTCSSIGARLENLVIQERTKPTR